MGKLTLVIGATENEARYANMAIKRLRKYNHPVVAIGLRQGKVEDVSFSPELLPFEDVDTVTLYVGPKNQTMYFEYITKVIQPKRVIFNPGTENPALEEELRIANIDYEHACTLVLLGAGLY